MPLKKPSLPGLLLSATLLPTLTGCATTTASVEPTTSSLTFCDGARPIFWAKRDTVDTIKQVKSHNAVGVDACGWGKKK